MEVSRNGAEQLVDTLLEHDVDVCFANPGTSEMNFVAALDQRPEMRCVLALFEGVATGAADGYARMADKPAATLLHLGPGLANGLANLHNAKRARTPMINVIGDHSDEHLVYDAPLTSDIKSLATPMSHWFKRASSVQTIAQDTSEAWQAAMSLPGITSLVLPVDVAWTPADYKPVQVPELTPAKIVSDEVIDQASAMLLKKVPTLILLGGRMARQKPLELIEKIAHKTGADILVETFVSRLERGRGRPQVDKLPYPIAQSLDVLKKYKQVLLVETMEPVAFFAYPNKPGKLLPEGCETLTLCGVEDDGLDALTRLAEKLGADTAPKRDETLPEEPEDLNQPVTDAGVCALVAALMPENAIICSETVSSAASFMTASRNSAPHDYIQLTGGAIGAGIPLALGAAIACPDRRVINLQADGSAMYTVQGLWSQANEKARVTTIIFANAEYKILQGELQNLGINFYGENARRMLTFNDPAPNWVGLAESLGVPARRANSLADFKDLLLQSFEIDGPFLIEVCI